jgi:hypothetical protein
MFCDSLTTKDKKLIKRDLLQIDDYVTTDPQAEILISDIIDKKYVKCVYFQNQQDIDDYILRNGSDVLNRYEHKIASRFFDYRKDYVFWKKES